MMYHAAALATQSTGQQWHVDHMAALVNGGKHSADNLQLLPDWLNLAKGAKDHEEFVYTNHLYSAWTMLSTMFPVQMPSLVKKVETIFFAISVSYVIFLDQGQ